MGLRNRSYSPVQVSITCTEADDSWSRRNEVAIQFTARRSNGEYQTLHLSRAEADKVAATIIARTSQEAREALIPRLLRDLSDPKLLKVLSADLRKRTAP